MTKTVLKTWIRVCLIFYQGYYRSWKTWKVMEFRCGSWKVIGEWYWLQKITKLGRFSCQLKQLNGDDDNFLENLWLRKWSDLGHRKLWKVMEFQKPNRVQTLSIWFVLILQILRFISFLCCNLTVGQDGSRSTACLWHVVFPHTADCHSKKRTRNFPRRRAWQAYGSYSRQHKFSWRLLLLRLVNHAQIWLPLSCEWAGGKGEERGFSGKSVRRMCPSPPGLDTNTYRFTTGK